MTAWFVWVGEMFSWLKCDVGTYIKAYVGSALPLTSDALSIHRAAAHPYHDGPQDKYLLHYIGVPLVEVNAYAKVLNFTPSKAAKSRQLFAHEFLTRALDLSTHDPPFSLERAWFSSPFLYSIVSAGKGTQILRSQHATRGLSRFLSCCAISQCKLMLAGVKRGGGAEHVNAKSAQRLDDSKRLYHPPTS